MSVILVALSTWSFAQTTEGEASLKAKVKSDTLDGWDNGGTFNLSFSQVSLTNWAGGGQNSMAINGLLSMYANKTVGDISWENSLDLAYGTLQQGDAGFIKSDDRINLNSKVGKQITDKLY